MPWLILAIFVWGWIHSLLATLGFKSWLQGLLGSELYRGYRLFYNLFSIISALPIIWLLSVLPDQKFYSMPAPWSLILVGIQVIAMLLLIIGVLQTDALAFVGLRQLFENRSVPLIKKGLYQFVRHPLYSLGLIFLWLSPSSTLNVFIVKLSLSIYLILGAYFEEKKLVREFGKEYLEYKRVTPMFIPRVF